MIKIKEKDGFRELLADILKYTDGKRLLTITDVKNYTGLKDSRTVKRRYKFNDGYISATELARQELEGV